MRRLLLIGCGDVALRVAEKLRSKYLIFALTRHAQKRSIFRKRGLIPLLGDLDDKPSLRKLAGISHDILHLAPPYSSSSRDNRTCNLLRALKSSGMLPQRLIYISTSGVYGHANGNFVSELTRPNPTSQRAVRRLDAELRLRDFGRKFGVGVSILRVPGIYSKDRLPLKTLNQNIPLIKPSQDSYSNHIHVTDLVDIIIATLRKGKPGRLYNVCDDSNLKFGEYFDIAAKLLGFEKPKRLSFSEVEKCVPHSIFSFIKESRRLDNQRLKKELINKLNFPLVIDGMLHK